MKHIGLFEGIGGFSLAARWAGWETVAWCEIDPFCQKVLSYHFPEAQQHGDIKTTDFSIYRGKCNILTGGFPCQPYSTAGKRLGKDDDRHLWPEMLRAIREIQPTWIVGENVRGLTNWNGGVVFDEVQADLEALGYEVQSFILPACAVNAPHRRDRVWIVAYRDHNGQVTAENRQGMGAGNDSDKAGENEAEQLTGCAVSEQLTPNPRSEQLQERPQNGLSEDRAEDGTGLDCGIERQGNAGATANAHSIGQSGRREQPEPIQQGQLSWSDSAPDVANSESGRFQGQRQPGNACEAEREIGAVCTCEGDSFNDVVANAHSIRHPGKEHGEARSKFNPENDTRPEWGNFPTQPPICGRNDGLSERLDGITFPKWRNESIKAYGNAIVPQVAYEIFKVINQMTE